MHKYHYGKVFEKHLRDLSKKEVVLDVGGGHPFTKYLEKYREWFNNCDYKTMDYDPTTNPDVVGDIHNIPEPDNKYDGILCLSVLEHVKEPQKAFNEMVRITKDGGKIIIWVPSTYPYHARKGHYPDFHRFFHDTIELMVKGVSSYETLKSGGYFKAMVNFLPFPSKIQRKFIPLALLLDKIFKTEERNITMGYYIFITK